MFASVNIFLDLLGRSEALVNSISAGNTIPPPCGILTAEEPLLNTKSLTEDPNV
jgi:hypothetical protein